jgi:peroxiredoxin
MSKDGDRAPFFSMIAAGSGRRVSLREAAGRTLVLIFHGRGGEEAVRDINRAIR